MKIYLDIINHFGVRNQMRKLNEEIFEFLEAVDFYEDSKISEDTKTQILLRDSLVDELGDVLLLLTQFIAKYQISKEELDKHMDYKLDRTIQRIKDNYYDEEKK